MKPDPMEAYQRPGQNPRTDQAQWVRVGSASSTTRSMSLPSLRLCCACGRLGRVSPRWPNVRCRTAMSSASASSSGSTTPVRSITASRRSCRGDKPFAGHIGPLWAILGRPRHPLEAHRTIRRDLSRALIASRWQSWFHHDRDAERELWGVILAHHGNLIDAVQPEPRLWRPRNGYDPVAALTELAATVAGMFPEAFVDDDPSPLPTAARFQHAFAGLVTLADWLGSDETVFRFPLDGAPCPAPRGPGARPEGT